MNLDKNFFITNWSKFPVYELDFGYGTPVKFRCYPLGVAVLLGTPADDGGIEMCINSLPEHMQNMEQDPEFKMFQ